jgi:acyl-CoA dehydrogenase
MGNRLGEKGMGFLMLMEKPQQERLTCAVGAVCGAEGILAWTMDYCRKTNRGGRPMSKSQAVRFELVEMANRTADRALSILVDVATVESCPLVRTWRDVRVMSIFAGTNEIMKGISAKFMGL